MSENAVQASQSDAEPKKARKLARKPKKARKPVSAPARPPTGLARVPSLPERIETLLMEGDLTGLSVPERLQFYNALCRTLGLNPLTRPFEYIVFTNRDQDEEADPSNADEEQIQSQPRGKMTLYARADCAAQLRKIHKVGIGKDMRRRRDGEFYVVEADAFIHDRAGIRTDTSTGIVWLKKWKRSGGNRSLVDLSGREMANAMMKAETKAKRRVTFSICGLHILDESELEDLTSMTFDVSESGRVIEFLPQTQTARANPDGGQIYELAVLMAQADKSSQIPFKDRVEQCRVSLNKHSPAQIEVLLQKFSQPSSEASAKAEGAATSRPEHSPVANVAPSDYPGITFTAGPNQTWQISGPKALLHDCREAIQKELIRVALPKLVCTSEGCGRLSALFEKLKVKHRMTPSLGAK